MTRLDATQTAGLLAARQAWVPIGPDSEPDCDCPPPWADCSHPPRPVPPAWLTEAAEPCDGAGAYWPAGHPHHLHANPCRDGRRVVQIEGDCPNDCQRFGGQVPGHVYGSNWDWVPCQQCSAGGTVSLSVIVHEILEIHGTVRRPRPPRYVWIPGDGRPHVAQLTATPNFTPITLLLADGQTPADTIGQWAAHLEVTE